MRKTTILNLVAFLILFAAITHPVAASRILTMPTADVHNDTLEIDFFYHRGSSILGAQYGFYPGLSAGLRQELGGSNRLYATLRAAISEETQSRPGVALGGELSLKQQHLYVVISKQLGIPGLRGHAALGFGRYSRGMAGVIYVLNPVKLNDAPTTSVFVESDGQGVNGGLIAQFSPELKAKVALSSGNGLSIGLNLRTAF